MSEPWRPCPKCGAGLWNAEHVCAVSLNRRAEKLAAFEALRALDEALEDYEIADDEYVEAENETEV